MDKGKLTARWQRDGAYWTVSLDTMPGVFLFGNVLPGDSDNAIMRAITEKPGWAVVLG